MQHKPVYESDLIAMSNNIEDIRYLTAHLNELQGLRYLPFGLFLLSEGLSTYTWAPWGSWVGSTLNVFNFVIIFCLVVLYGFIRMYYESSFGEVIPLRASWKRILVILGFHILLILGIVLDGNHLYPFSFTWMVIGLFIISMNIKGKPIWGMIILGIFIILFSISSTWGAMLLLSPVFHVICGFIIISTGIYQHFKLIADLDTIQQSLAAHG